jgi:hypothetical protein
MTKLLHSGFSVLLMSTVATGCVVHAAAPPPVAAPIPAPTAEPVATPAPAATPPATDAVNVAAPVDAAFDPNGAADPSKIIVYVEPAEVAEPAAESKVLSADGRPKDFKAGAADAVYLWQDARGTRWHLRTTTTGAWHRFRGYIVAESTFTGVKPTKTEWADRVRVTDKRIGFDFFTRGGTDGFDFNVTGDKCVRFAVLVDGKPQADKVKLGAASTAPARAHFKLCP